MSDPKPADVTAGDTVVEGLAAVLAEHESYWGSDDYTRCTCGVLTGTLGGLIAHVAAALAPTVTAMVTAGQAEALEAVAEEIQAVRIAAQLERDSGEYRAGLDHARQLVDLAAATVREGADR